MNDSKKRLDDQQEMIEGHDDVKKKMQRDIDALQQRVDSLTDENDRMNKSKKKMQTEVRALHVNDLLLHPFLCRFLSYRHHLTTDDFLEDKREDCQIYSVLYCVCLLG